MNMKFPVSDVPKFRQKKIRCPIPILLVTDVKFTLWDVTAFKCKINIPFLFICTRAYKWKVSFAT